MDVYLNKKFKLKISDKFDEYLKFIGVGLLSRKLACSVSPLVYFVLNPDGSYTFVMTTTLRNITINFRLDEEFVEERADGIKVKSIITLEDGKLVQIQIEDSGRVSKHVREIVGDTLTVKTTVDGWPDECIRTYQLVN